METYSEIRGLSLADVKQQQALGLVNEPLDSYNTTYPRIVVRNIFNIINLVVFPLLAALFYFQIYTEVFSFGLFLVINTIVSLIDEVRVKRQIDSLKKEFQQKVNVIREGVRSVIPVGDVVQGDFVYAGEGDGIIADGDIVASNYLQVDESVLTGESNYIEKDKQDKVMAGSFIVTGNCVYIVKQVGKNNYLNQLGKETLRFKTAKSSLQQNGDRIIAILVALSLVLGFANFYATQGQDFAERLLSLTVIISLIIPQTLVFLFTLSFTISIVKLSSRGVLVRKGGSIQELADIDVICFDKTGTITTNEMKLIETKSFGVDLDEVGGIYNAIQPQIVGITKTQELLHSFFSTYAKSNVSDFDQVPFTSKQKFSMISGVVDAKQFRLAFGAASVLLPQLDSAVRSDVETYVAAQERAGNRVIIGIFNANVDSALPKHQIPTAKEAIVFTIEETLNPGIDKLLADLASQGIDVKIISGDSATAVGRIAQKIGIPADKILDLSVDRERLLELVNSKSIFTRANPEDKVVIVNALKATGRKVAMIGDGINDVLAMKSADVSIAMESAARITHDTADIVLLHNDYAKVPTIFYEGDNIIFNLKLSTKIFLAKTLMGALLAAVFSAAGHLMPVHPTSTLIFSFLGSSAPSYVLVFTRQKTNNGTHFFREVLLTSITTAISFATVVVAAYVFLSRLNLSTVELNASIILVILAMSVAFSLYLSWEAGKIRSLLVLAILFIVPMILGVFQTVLPITAYQRSDQIAIALFAAAGLAFIAVITYPLIKAWPLKRRLLIYIGVPIIVSGLFFFPFQTYYDVVNVPAIALPTVVQIAALGVVLMLVINRLRVFVSSYWKD